MFFHFLLFLFFHIFSLQIQHARTYSKIYKNAK